MKKWIVAIVGLLISFSALAQYAYTPSNAYMFEHLGKQYTIAMVQDDFGYNSLILAQLRGGTWSVIPPYIDDNVTNIDIIRVGGAYGYMKSMLPRINELFAKSALPTCPANQDDKVTNVAYDLGSNDMVFDPITRLFIITRVPPLSHSECP